MAHPARPLEADLTLHVTAHALPGLACFPDEESRSWTRSLLARLLRLEAVELHAFAMMDSHIHMLVTARKAGAVACFLRRVLSSHALALNRVMERRGPLWEDRYRSVLVTDEEHALHASLYIDANPWRARVVDHPADSGWTSYRGLIRGQQDAFLVPHPVLMELGEGSDWRRRYGQIMNEYLRRASRTSMPRTWDPNTDPLAGLRLCTWRE